MRAFVVAGGFASSLSPLHAYAEGDAVNALCSSAEYRDGRPYSATVTALNSKRTYCVQGALSSVPPEAAPIPASPSPAVACAGNRTAPGGAPVTASTTSSGVSGGPQQPLANRETLTRTGPSASSSTALPALAIAAALAVPAYAESDPAFDFSNATRDEVTACLAEVRDYHAIRYPTLRARSDEHWACCASKDGNLHKPARDKMLAGESDLYVFAMEDVVAGGGLRVWNTRAALANAIKRDRDEVRSGRTPESRAGAKVRLCFSRTRLARLGGDRTAGAPVRPATGATDGMFRNCDNNYTNMLRQLRPMRLSEEERNRRHGEQIRAIYSGACAEAPMARSRLALADRLLGGLASATAQAGGGVSKQGRKDKRRHVPESVASKCLSLLYKTQGIDTLHGGFKNSCSFPIMYGYCVYRPKKGAWTEAMDCEKPSGPASWQTIGPNGTDGNHTKGGQRVHWVACRWEDGISLKDVKWDPGQQRLSFRCGE